MIAIPWYFVYSLKQESFFGTMYALTTIFTFIWNPYAGTLIDRYSRKKIALIISAVCGSILLLIAFYGFWTNSLPLALVIVVFATTLLNYNIYYPNLYALAQEITDKKDYAKMNSYLEVQGQFTMMMAGAMAAILLTGIEVNILHFWGLELIVQFSVSPWTLKEIFLLNSITYFSSFLIICFIRYVPQLSRNIESGSLYKRTITGFRFLKNNPMIFIFGNTSYSVFVTVMVCGYFVFPMYVNNYLNEGAEVIASSEIFFAMGALTAGIFTRKILKYFNTITIIIMMLVLTGLAFYLGVSTQYTSVFYIICVMLGLCNSGTRILRVTYLFNHVSNDIIGRAGSVFAMINILIRSAFIGLFSLAMFTDGSNVTNAFGLLGCFAVLSGLALLIYYKKMPKN